MGIQFSDDGPLFPEDLVDELLAGDVVFLCGAGVSAPQLPQFSGLVDQCFLRLDLEQLPWEQGSIEANRYEEALGSLSRRLAHPEEVVKMVVDQLQATAKADLEHHRTILRLSKNRANVPVVVTTNFDTLFERAMLDFHETPEVRRRSFAGQDLPAPGGSQFAGIVHLHGRIEDEAVGLEGTSLVLTSAEYGNAYMRSGWASRFLFDLARCKTVVLIGYSASDSPVRYFLNVLDADRSRFPDLRKVYALDGIADRSKDPRSWKSLAVDALLYNVHANAYGGPDHSALWRDLSSLADLIERPRLTLESWVRRHLSSPLASRTPSDLGLLSWALRHRPQLLGLAAVVIEDEAWFQFFEARGVCDAETRAWALATWVAHDVTSVHRFNVALVQGVPMGSAFLQPLGIKLQFAAKLGDGWRRAWQLLLALQPSDDHRFLGACHSAKRAVQASAGLQSHLQEAVNCLTPVLSLMVLRDGARSDEPRFVPQQASDLVAIDWRLPDDDACEELVQALATWPSPLQVLNVATSSLQAFTRCAQDCGQIDDDYDVSEYSVPSIEPHPQNAHHSGPVFLTQLLAQALPRLDASGDRAVARATAELWRAMPGSLGVRLWLHALRQANLYASDEAIEGVLSLPHELFWRLRRELALVLRDRAGAASSASVQAVEERIMTEGAEYFAQYVLHDGEMDWRNDARDLAVWLRLQMLRVAGRLTKAGQRELQAIMGRHQHLDRSIEDRDFFAVYSLGMQVPKARELPIADESAEDPLHIARELVASAEVGDRHAWSVHCRSDPVAAFELLAQAPLATANAALWRDFLNVLATSPQGEAPTAPRLMDDIWLLFRPATDEFLRPLVASLASLYGHAERRSVDDVTFWWPRLFAMSVDTAPRWYVPAENMLRSAANSPCGQLTEALILDIHSSVKQKRRRFMPLLVQAASGAGHQGALARAVLLASAGFTVSLGHTATVRTLKAALKGRGLEAVDLREVLSCHSRASAVASRTFRDELLQGLGEFKGRSRSAVRAAAKFMLPSCLAQQGDQSHTEWGLGIADARRLLREGASTLRAGALVFLKEWLNDAPEGRTAAWQSTVGPLLEQVWPKERSLSDATTTRRLSGLIIGADGAFPDALKQMGRYLCHDSRNDSASELDADFGSRGHRFRQREQAVRCS